MWRQKKFQENPDSDQSISEDEEYDDGDVGGNCVSLRGNAEKEEALLLQARLEMLRGSRDLDYARDMGNLSRKASLETSPSVEDYVEVPDSPNEGDLAHSRRTALTCTSDKELVSDDEKNNVLSKVSMAHGTKLFHKDDHHFLRRPVATWSAVTKETKALIHMNCNASRSSSYSAYTKANTHSKGVKDKGKPKFSFHFNSHKEKSSKTNEMAENLETIDQAIEDDPIAGCLEDLDGNPKTGSVIVHGKSEVVRRGCTEHSITELLDSRQDNSSSVKGNFKMYSRRKGRSLQHTCKRSRSTLSDRVTDDELPEPMYSGSSSDDEPNCQNSLPPIAEQTKQFVADRFHEALKATSLSSEGLSVNLSKSSGHNSSGLFGMLQQVMLREKEKETNFLKKLQTGAGQLDESSYIDVKIISRYLDARLIVCKCSVIKNSEDYPVLALVNEGRERTIIFTPKVCGNVELEVGSLIRIHTPWKKMVVKATDERIVLCTYFSDMVT